MKRLSALFLSLLLLVMLLPVEAMAVDTMTISAEGLAFIQEFEGFEEYAYEDGGNWYIGYGTQCERDEYPYGITQEEATELMLEHLEEQETRVNVFLNQYQIQLEQYQFDALMSLTYNLGTTWINPTYRLCQYLMNGIENYSTDEVVNAIGTWCHVGEEPVLGLAQRRLQEAYLFLYGEYDNTADEEYVYVHFDVGDGEIEHSTAFYPINQSYGTLPSATCRGQYFQGWYYSNGTQFTADDIATANITVYAQWGRTAVADLGLDATPWENPFADVRERDWFYAYVKNLTRAGMINGYGDGTFLPQNNITAGEALKIILLAAGEEEQTVADVSVEHWANGYYQLAISKGYIDAADIADLDDPIDRGLIAKLAAQAMGLTLREGESPFVDTDSPYAAALYEVGVVMGSYDAQDQLVYLPDDSITRAEICAIVWRMYQCVPDQSEPDEPDVPDEPDEPEKPEEPEEELTPEELGYIPFRDYKVPILEDVPVCEYDKDLFYLDGSVMVYDDPDMDTSIGIDVSSYQGEIDWQQVKQSGVEFAFIRVGFRGYTEGTLNLDSKFHQNVQGALDAGLDVGVYFFSQAITPQEAIDEAEYVLDAIAGYDITYPVVFDWETIGSSNARTNDIDNQTLTDCAIAFSERIADEGYTPMVYFNLTVGYLMYDLSQLTDYDFWFAQYPSSDAMYPTMYYNYQMWQYTSSGSVPGIEGNVDMNIAWKRW